MHQQERFEAQYADQHDVPIETMKQYRMGDSYRLPAIAAHYRTFRATEAGLLATISKVVIDCGQWTEDDYRKMAEAGHEPFTPNMIKAVAP